ncbi:MAG: transglycosylase SLT domain-containing protein [Gammaproteobacteria bacterium]|nr:transglycosylase SLT domain-containing protein [Gammaproteobacteria bacterium]MDH3768227.1 transglycosylase SLT domain-containing protein [Gammaproteobacteria bacterium]
MYRALIAALLLLLPQLATANWPQRLEDQRDAFRDAWQRALDGDASAIRQNQLLLADYPLYPDLQAAWLRSQVGKIADSEIDEFVSNHSGSSAVRDLRYRWAKSLAARGQWSKYLAVYDTEYAQSDDEILACLALTARLRTGPDSRFAPDALAYWMSGKSRATECDPVFDALEQQGLIDDEHRRERIMLALKKRKFELAAWLAKPMQDEDQELVQKWRRMRHRPATALSKTDSLADTDNNKELLIYGVKRLARSDFDAASAAWSRIETAFNFDASERRSVIRSLALTSARNHLPQAQERIFGLERHMIDDTLLEWGVRIALRNGDWLGLLQAIAAMSNDNKGESKWQYWQARALEASGRSDEAASVYASLSQSRGYYQFLAADRLATPYEYNHVPALPDEALLLRLETIDGLVRAREMFFVELHGKGRSEWDQSVKALNRQEKAQSAILASRWGWHSRAISTAARAGIRDDLSLSYPMAFRELFETHTTELGLPTTWAFGIARSESLFMPDVTSTAGALGVMQVTPDTGRMTARQAKMRYRGRYTLLNPKDNIALGTFYLDRMYARFDDHQVLATAAYNAGPHRVARWLPKDEAMAADIWVELVPYTETRGYLRRVLAADVIFHWRLTGETQRLAAIMPPVPTSAN